MKARMKKKLESKKLAAEKVLAEETALREKQEENEFHQRISGYFEELRRLYNELYPNQQETFDELCVNIKKIYKERKEDLKILDRERKSNPDWYKKNDILGMMMYVDRFSNNLNGVSEKLDYIQECNVNFLHLMPFLESQESGTMEDLEKFSDECRRRGISLCMDLRMTASDPGQQDLSEMISGILNLANKGIDVIRIDQQIHSVVRIMRIICEIVCPGALLLGTADMEPEEAISYMGTVEKPEFHMLDDVTMTAAVWHTVATRDVRLLRCRMDLVNHLQKDHVFLNYLRSYDGIGWKMDYEWLKQFGTDETAHKRYLSDFFTGNFPGSFGRGELYNDDPMFGAVRQCGTTASLCGVEKAAYEDNEEALRKAVRLDLTLHACLLIQTGIPVICSGDEIGQENDYSYHQDTKKCEDSRYLHGGRFQWEKAELRSKEGTVQAEIFRGLKKMEEIRGSHDCFAADADIWTVDTWDDSILGLVKTKNGEKLVALFNFSECDKVAWINEEDGMYTDLLSGREMEAKGVQIPAYGCFWLLKK